MAEVHGIIGTLDRYGLDALVMPTFTSFHLPAIAGLPIVTVPLGFYPPDTETSMDAKGTLVNVAPNIPFGIAFIGRRWSEETLISLAYAFEQRTMIRTKSNPHIIPTYELGDRRANTYQTEALLSSTDSNQILLLSEAEATKATIKRNLFFPRSWSWSLLARTDSSL